MKTLLYEIRYYLAATVLVLLLVPDKEETPLIPEVNATAKPISTIRKSQIEYPAYLRIGPDRELDIELQLFLEEELKKNKKGFEKEINDLFPEPNHH